MFTTFLNRNKNQMANPKVLFDMTIGSAPADRIVIKLQMFNHKISYKCAATYYPIVNTTSSNMFTTFLNRNQNQMANPKVFLAMTIDSAPAGRIVIKLQKFNHKISYKCAATYYPIVNTASSVRKHVHNISQQKPKSNGKPYDVLRHDHRQRPSRPDRDQIAKV
ncbi:hypothetical protein SASPL_126197 [Salvia splendens]|uniref:Uncharacterized protein n=1 Tax=Salvia splendens TaxID=180675 RepID=A0A8X8XJ11_SALSN|nr:hypothetical protein SASPL_126197 [Salvia splendens]